MDILAISYNNIGPFFDQTLTVSFVQGASLIKAPIGSGKSFLFFDGPLYALYKTSSRQLLSRHAAQGRIHCIFEHNDTVRYVERLIKKTKAGNDSAQSRLYQVTGDRTELLQKIQTLPAFGAGFDCKDLVSGGLDEIEASSQRELEEMLKALLPPRELFLSVHLMMQDADHIFELPAGQRVTIFKHLFGLLGIDDAKDTLHSRRRELQTKIAFLEEKETNNDKIRDLLTKLFTHKEKGATLFVGETAPLREKVMDQPFFKDSDLIDPQDLSIAGFSIEKSVITAVQELLEGLEILREEKVKKTGVREERQKQVDALVARLSGITKEQTQLQATITTKDQQLKDDTAKEYEALQKEVTTIQQEKETRTKDYSEAQFASCGAPVDSLHGAVAIINQWINDGKQGALEQDVNNKAIEQQQQQHEKLTVRKKQIDEQMKVTQSNYAQQTRFECDKIQGPCPYIDVLNKAAIKTIQEQLDATQQQQQETTTGLEESTKRLEKLTTEQQQLAEKKEQLGTWLQTVGRKKLQENYDQTIALQRRLDEKMRTLQSLKDRYDQRQKIQQERDHANIQLTGLQEQTKTLEAQKEDLHTLLLADKEEGVSLEILGEAQQSAQEIKELMNTMITVIEQYAQQQKEKFVLTQELKKVKELYQIFSKELLVVVLQDFLPQLEEVINAYLVQVVDYQIRFMSPKSVDDAIELDVEVDDALGVRSVNSLSGGQRAVLKICRILAVSSLFRSKFLFLDETITSLDPDTVSRVAEMIHAFVRAHEMKFYVVTHAEKIQEMSIWDRIVQIKDDK